MLIVNVSISLADQPHGEALQVWHQNETMASRLQQCCGLLEKKFWLQQMLQDSPESDGIETPCTKIVGGKISANHRYPLGFRIVERRTANVGAGNLVICWKLLV